MSYRILDPRGLKIDRLDQEAQRWALHFAEANIEKIMDNAEQRTLWTQAGSIEIRDPKPSAELPAAPFSILHADLDDGLYVQRDMIRLPSDVSGEVVLSLQIDGRAEPLRLGGSRVCLHFDGDPRYVRHLDPDL